MRLLEVNGISLLGASHQESVNALRSAGSALRLLVCDGYDSAEVERLQMEGLLVRDCKSTSESVSSLDRLDDDEPVSQVAQPSTKEEAPIRASASLPVSPTLDDREVRPCSEKVTNSPLLYF